MKFALAVHGSRGDVESCAAVGLELLCRSLFVYLRTFGWLRDRRREEGLCGAQCWC
jgi:UDP:flavonoid glycosyltransferase YjiC (YdhE family)